MKTKTTLLTLLTTATLSSATKVTYLCSQYAFTTQSSYMFNNNEYNSASVTGSNSQCLTVRPAPTAGPGCAWTVGWDYSDVTTTGGVPIAYPYSGIDADNSNLVSDIKSMPTRVKWSYSSSGSYGADVIYDIFTNSVQDTPTYYGEYEIEIRLDAHNAYNFGKQIGRTKINGIEWTVFFAQQTIHNTPNQGNITQSTFSFYHPKTQHRFQGDVIDFFNYMDGKEGFDSSKQYLKTFQFGTETYRGGPATLRVDRWEAAVDL